MNLILLSIIIFIVTFVSIAYFIYYTKMKNEKGWECVEGDCELIVNGSHSSKKKCEESCSTKNIKKVTFSVI